MNFFRQWGLFMMMGARAHARWEINVSNTILGDKKRMIILGLLTLPILLGGIAFADPIGNALPDLLGGKKRHRVSYRERPQRQHERRAPGAPGQGLCP